ncbi:putative helicase [Dirofilaria immitis]
MMHTIKTNTAETKHQSPSSSENDYGPIAHYNSKTISSICYRNLVFGTQPTVIEVPAFSKVTDSEIRGMIKIEGINECLR